MLAESMDDRQNPFLAFDGMVKLFDLTVVVLESFANAHILVLSLRIYAWFWVKAMGCEVIERHGGYCHVAG